MSLTYQLAIIILFFFDGKKDPAGEQVSNIRTGRRNAKYAIVKISIVMEIDFMFSL